MARGSRADMEATTPADMAATTRLVMGQTTASGRRSGLLTAVGVGAKSAVTTGTERGVIDIRWTTDSSRRPLGATAECRISEPIKADPVRTSRNV